MFFISTLISCLVRIKFLKFRLAFLGVLESLYWSAPNFWFSRSGHVSDACTWGEIPFFGEWRLCFYIISLLHFGCMGLLGVLVVESFWILVKWIYGGCYQSTFGIGGTSVFKYSGLSIAALEWSGFISSLYFGLQLELYHFKCFVCLFAGPGLSFRFSVPGRCSIGCIGSELAFFCEVARSSTCLTRRVNSFWLSFGSVTVFIVDNIYNVVFVVVGEELFAPLFLLPEFLFVLSACSICLFGIRHGFF